MSFVGEHFVFSLMVSACFSPVAFLAKAVPFEYLGGLLTPYLSRFFQTSTDWPKVNELG